MAEKSKLEHTLAKKKAYKLKEDKVKEAFAAKMKQQDDKAHEEFAANVKQAEDANKEADEAKSMQDELKKA